MKSTGVVRRIDELGRIVIPKEIRNNLRIKEGDDLEIYTNEDSSVVLKKHSKLNKFNEMADVISKSLSKFLNKNVIITDKNCIISQNKLFKDKQLSSSFSNLLENRVKIVQNKKTEIQITDIKTDYAYIIEPLILNGDLVGSIVVLSSDIIDKSDELVCSLGAKIFLNYIE